MRVLRSLICPPDGRPATWWLAASSALVVALLVSLAAVPVAAEGGPSNGAIVFGAAPPHGVWIANPDASNLQLIFEPGQGTPFPQAASPDGSEILYVSRYGFDSLRIVGVDGSNDRQIVPFSRFGLNGADWSSDGATILYETWSSAEDGRSRVVPIDTEGYNEREIKGLPHAMRSTKLSPDGTKLAFHGPFEGFWQLLLADVDLSGSGDVEATNIRVLAGPEHAGSPRGISWSPDGSHIAFGGSTDNLPQPPWWDCHWEPTPWDVFVVEVATGELTNVTDTVGLADGMEAYPSFSPDGTQLAFAAYSPATCEDGRMV